MQRAADSLTYVPTTYLTLPFRAGLGDVPRGIDADLAYLSRSLPGGRRGLLFASKRQVIGDVVVLSCKSGTATSTS
jgi:hypothetical protein